MATNQITAFATCNAGPNREILEDFSLVEKIRTAGELNLYIAIVCDGVGEGTRGKETAELTAQEIVNFLKNSPERNISYMLEAAIQHANSSFFEENEFVEKAEHGKSTVALIAINEDDGEYGRMFVASVGDSHIYLMRDGHLLRLNRDHTIAADAIFNEGYTVEEAEQLDNYFHLTRIIGIEADIEVDTGIYFNFRDMETAQKYGLIGIQLAEGDTVFACSDGLVDIDPEDDRPYVRDEEFLAYAMDDDVVRSVNTILSHALMRNPNDNIALAMIFIPSPNRHSASILQLSRLSTGAKVLLTLLVLLVLGGLALIGYLIFQDLDSLEEGQASLNQAYQEGTAWALGLTQTFEAIPTTTPTPSPTPRPILNSGQVGFIDPPPADQNQAILSISQEVRAEDNAQLSIVWKEDGEVQDPTFAEFDAHMYLSTASQLEFLDVDFEDEYIELRIYENSEIFIQTGNYAEILVEHETLPLQMTVSGSCMSVKTQFPVVEIGCFEGRCEYEYGQQGEIVRIDQGQAISMVFMENDGESNSEDPYILDPRQTRIIDISYEYATVYYDFLRSLPGQDSQIDSQKCIQDWNYLEATSTPDFGGLELNN